MKYSKTLKSLFSDIELITEDLLLLETFQIKSLPDRVPKQEFSALLRTNPIIQWFLISKYPDVKNFVNEILNEFEPVKDKTTIKAYCQ